MTERDTIRLLRVIRDLAMLPYPYPGGTPKIDGNLLLALGQIAGLASKALGEFDDRQAAAVGSEGDAEPAADQVGARRRIDD